MSWVCLRILASCASDHGEDSPPACLFLAPWGEDEDEDVTVSPAGRIGIAGCEMRPGSQTTTNTMTASNANSAGKIQRGDLCLPGYAVDDPDPGGVLSLNVNSAGFICSLREDIHQQGIKEDPLSAQIGSDVIGLFQYTNFGTINFSQQFTPLGVLVFHRASQRDSAVLQFNDLGHYFSTE